MSIVVRYAPVPSSTIEQYDEVMRRLQESGEMPADGFDYHVAFISDGQLLVSEVWDSPQQLEAFGARIMPLLLDVALEHSGQPEIFESTTSSSAKRVRIPDVRRSLRRCGLRHTCTGPELALGDCFSRKAALSSAASRLLLLVLSGHVDRSALRRCFTHRSGNTVDVLPAGIVERQARSPSPASERGSDVRSVTVSGAIDGAEPTGGALLDRAVPPPVRQGEFVGHRLGTFVGVVDDPV